MKKSLAIIGQGFVGGSLTTVFAERGFDVIAYDKMGKVALGGRLPYVKQQSTGNLWKPKSIAELIVACENRGSEDITWTSEIEFSGVYFVCLPTPMFEDGSADLSIVEGVLKELASVPGERIAVIKSTIPPGSTERWNQQFKDTGLHVIFNPEFLREASALDDMRNQNRIILGGPRPWINKVKEIYQSAWSDVPIKKTSSTTAEMVKYVTNIHLAVKVALANEFYQICDSLDKVGANIDYDKVVEYALFDERLGKSHWQVPGPMPADDTGNPAFGFGGSCFVKDLNALIAVAKQLGIEPKVMAGAWAKNLEVRPQRDWEKLIGRAISKKD
jgi:nucleotide sugar dehydrogenase